MELRVTKYSGTYSSDWDRLVEGSTSGTFLQTRRFLGYHEGRFADASICVWDGNTIVGVMPAARDPENDKIVISHPGITYGGLLHSGKVRGQDMLDAFRCVLAHYAAEGYTALRYKAVPVVYHRAPSQDDLYALFRLSAQRYRCDLSVAIDLQFRLEVSSCRRRGIRKAEKAGVVISENPVHNEDLWQVLDYNLSSKHGARPVHSLEEIRLLFNLFPHNILFLSALQEREVVAGAVLFLTPMAVHAQYICSNDKGYAVNALDLAFERIHRHRCIEGCALR